MSINELNGLQVKANVDEDDAIRRFLEKLEKPAPTLEERNAERAKYGMLPITDKYNPVCHAHQEDVELEPERFVVPECIPACKELWSKNVYTFMVSDELNMQHGETWIEIVNSVLSAQNLAILKSLEDDNEVRIFHYHEGCTSIAVHCVGLEAQQKLLEIAKRFEKQDVPGEYVAYFEYVEGYQPKDDEVIDGDRVYISPFHLEKHRSYVNSH